MATRYLDLETAPEPTLTVAETRIPISAAQRPRYRQADLTDAIDFLSFGAGVANVIMQLSWPEVGYGVKESRVESGRVDAHPWKRARTTFTYLSVAITGTDEDKRLYREAVDAVHRQVRSDENSPVKYNAMHRELQMWVAACLYVGFEDTHELLHGAMTPAQAEQFYRSASALGTTLQVTEDMWPSSRAEFDRYWNTAAGRVSIDDPVREYLSQLVDSTIFPRPLRAITGPLLRFLTIGFLPPLFRDQMRLDWTEVDQRRFDRLFAGLARLNAVIPRGVRHLPYALLLRDVRWRARSGRSLV